MATAELAAALPVLVVLLGVGLAAVDVAEAKLRCVDGAREAARAVARGDTEAAPALARAAAGPGASMHSEGGPERVRVTVAVRLRPVSWLAGITVSDTAVVAMEPPP